MIDFRNAPSSAGAARLTVTAGIDLDDALRQFGQREDCIGCSTTVAAPPWTPAGTIERVLATFSPLSEHGPVLRPGSAAGGLLRRGNHWVAVDVDAGAQRLHTVQMPAELVGAQRLLAVNDLRGVSQPRPAIAIGLWALFAHPIVRASARLAGERDGLTAEIALAVHPDRYIAIESDRNAGLAFIIESTDPIATELFGLALRDGRMRVRGTGPWEDPLIQAATELDLGARTFDQIDIDGIVSPTLSSDRQARAAVILTTAAELIGVRPRA